MEEFSDILYLKPFEESSKIFMKNFQWNAVNLYQCIFENLKAGTLGTALQVKGSHIKFLQAVYSLIHFCYNFL